MSASGFKSLPSIGFFTVADQQDQGVIGAYLILNARGRPLEFHCTTPVKANRAQQILYGPTLQPYLLGEQIGHTLLKKAKTKPLFVCTNLLPALAVRQLIELPVVLVLDDFEVGENENEIQLRIDHGHRQVPPPSSEKLIEFSLGSHQLAVAVEHETDRDTVLGGWQAHGGSLDLCEPFQRVHQAIDEARSATG